LLDKLYFNYTQIFENMILKLQKKRNTNTLACTENKDKKSR